MSNNNTIITGSQVTVSPTGLTGEPWRSPLAFDANKLGGYDFPDTVASGGSTFIALHAVAMGVSPAFNSDGRGISTADWLCLISGGALTTEAVAARDDIVAAQAEVAANTATVVALANDQPTDPVIVGWIYSEAYRIAAANRDADGNILTASVIWPNGATGALTVTERSSSGAINAYTITYVLGDVSRIYTQPTITRDANDIVTFQPAITPAASEIVSDATVLGWIYTSSYRLISATRNGNGVTIAASIAWPNDATGTYAADVLNAASGAVDAYHITYVLGDVSRTYTQPAVTRDGSGAVIVQPAIMET